MGRLFMGLSVFVCKTWYGTNEKKLLFLKQDYLKKNVWEEL